MHSAAASVKYLHTIKMEDNYRHKGLRKRLVEALMEKGITDSRVLEAMLAIPRHFFFEKAFLDQAYEDSAFPIACNQTISQPYTVAYQSQLLSVKPGDKVLEIGTGSGYQAAILSRMGALVYTIERKKELYDSARELLSLLGLKAHFHYGDGTLGWPEPMLFDGIIATAGAPQVPETLLGQLANGGRMVVPVGSRDSQQMVLITRDEIGNLTEKKLDYFRFVPLLGREGWDR